MMRFILNVSHGVTETCGVYFWKLCDKNVVVFGETCIKSSWNFFGDF